MRSDSVVLEERVERERERVRVEREREDGTKGKGACKIIEYKKEKDGCNNVKSAREESDKER